MRASTIVLWSLVGLLLGIAVAASCANSDPPACDQVQCDADCRRVGHLGGICDRGACTCTSAADADADADADVPVDADADTDDVRVDTEIRTDDGGDETIIRDETVDPEGGEGGEGGEAKSGCDPLLCFLSCGGTCNVGGACECPSPAP